MGLKRVFSGGCGVWAGLLAGTRRWRAEGFFSLSGRPPMSLAKESKQAKGCRAFGSLRCF